MVKKKKYKQFLSVAQCQEWAQFSGISQGSLWFSSCCLINGWNDKVESMLIKFTDKAILTKTLGAVIKIQTSLSEVSYGQGSVRRGGRRWGEMWVCLGEKNESLKAARVRQKWFGVNQMPMNGIDGIAPRNVGIAQAF